MPLWRFVPVADRHDSRWQDRRIWRDVVVRAPSAAMARVLAAQAEERNSNGRIGNESRADCSGFADSALYWVQRLPKEEAEKYGGENSPDGVVNRGTPEIPLLSVYYGPSVVWRRGGGETPTGEQA